MTKPMSAAEYRANAQRVRDQRPTEIVTLKSGSVFELRRPDLQAYVVTGRMPQSLLNAGLKAWREQGKAPEGPAENTELTQDVLIFMREIVHDCTVNPKFVQFATEDNQIGAADMLPDDFSEIFTWAMSNQGVAGIEGPQTFRGGQKRRTAGSRSRGKKLRSDTKPDVESGVLVS